MARDYGRFKITIWQNEDFLNLSFGAQRLYFYLASQSKLDMAGVTPWRPRMVMRSASDLTEDTVAEHLAELERSLFVLLDEDTDELLVRSFIRSDEVLRSPNLAKAMVKAWRGIDSETLRAVAAHEVGRLRDEDPSLKGLDHCGELFDHPSIDPRNNPFGKGFGKGSGKGCRTTATTTTPLTTASTPALDGSASSESAPDRFEEFWSHYPRKVGKKAAKTKFAAACKRADEQQVIDGAAQLAADPNLPEERFIPHPTTWLERDGWEDGPLPPRTGGADQRRAENVHRISQHNPWTPDQPTPDQWGEGVRALGR